MCIDYRRLNDITKKNRAPIPMISELRERTARAKVFTKIDLRDGFHNILVWNEDREKTAFKTRYGHYEYNVLPFGLCNAPVTFQTMINRIIGSMSDRSVVAYVDDILVFSENEKDPH